MVRGVYAWDVNRERIEQLPNPWEAWLTPDSAAKVIDVARKVCRTEWEFHTHVATSYDWSSEDIAKHITKEFGQNVRISTNLEEAIKGVKMAQKVTMEVPVSFFSDGTGSEILRGQGLSGCELYGANLQVGVNLRKRLAFMIFDPTPKYFGEFKLAPYDWWKDDPELCKIDREELYSRLGDLVNKVCFNLGLENKCTFNYNKNGHKKLE